MRLPEIQTEHLYYRALLHTDFCTIEYLLCYSLDSLQQSRKNRHTIIAASSNQGEKD